MGRLLSLVLQVGTVFMMSCTGLLNVPILKGPSLSVELYSINPQSPSRHVSPPRVITALEESVVTVVFFKDSACSLPIGSGSRDEAMSLGGISVGVSFNAVTRIYAQGRDGKGRSGNCIFLVEYVHKTTPPADPVFVSINPGTSGSATAPMVVGELSEDTSEIRLFRDNSCSTLIGSTNNVGLFASTGVAATVLPNATTEIYAQARDLAGNSSQCVIMSNYTHDDTAPTLSLMSITPASPSNSSTTPQVKGSTSADTVSVRLYLNNSSCLGGASATGTRSEFEGSGVSVSVGSNSSTSIHAVAVDGAGNESSCTLLGSYTNDSVAPSAPSFVQTVPASPSNVSTTPVVKGLSSSDTVAVKLYSNNSCTTNLASGSKAEFEGTGIQISVGADTITQIYAHSEDLATNRSACILLSSYEHSSTAPAAPQFVSITPASPSNSSTTPTLRGTAASTVTTLRLHSNASCTALLASGTKAEFEGTGIQVSVGANATTSLYAIAEDALGNPSACTHMVNFTHDTVAPAAPSFAAALPVSPSSDSTPGLRGSSSADTASVRVFSNNTCTTEVGSGSKAEWEAAGGITLSTALALNASTTLYARAQDAAGNLSAGCTLMTDYTHDNTAPAAPSFVSTTPVSPSNSSTSPGVRGSTSSDTVTVRLYLTNTCASEVANGTKAQFEAIAGLTVNVTADATTTVYARSEDAAGNLSTGCTLMGAYTHDSVAPTAPVFGSFTPVSASNSSTTPVIKGTADSDTASLQFYSNSACSSSALGLGTRADFEGTAGIGLTVSANTLTVVYARALDAATNQSACTLMGSYRHDSTAPTAVTSITHAASRGSLTDSPAITWSGGATDTGGSGFSHYEYSMGTAAGGTQVRTWTSTGSTAGVTATGLTLTVGTAYFVNVRVVDLAGNPSTATSSSGWLATGPAAQVLFTSAPSGSATAGANFSTQPVVQVRDSGGNVVTDYVGSVSLAAFTDSGCSVASGASLRATTNPVSSSVGNASFSGVNHTRAETLYIRASSGALTSACAGPVTITPGPPTRLGFVTQPASFSSGSSMGVSPQVAIQDAFSNTVSSASDSIRFYLNRGGTNQGAVPVSGEYDGRIADVGASSGFVVPTTNGQASLTGLTSSLSTGSLTQSAAWNANQSIIARSATYGTVYSSTFTIWESTPSEVRVLGPKTILPNLCSGAFLIGPTDASGNFTSSNVTRTLTISGKSSGEFYTDSSCSTVASDSWVLAPPDRTRTLYYKTSASSGSLNFSASVTTGPTLTVRPATVLVGEIEKIETSGDVNCALASGSVFCWGWMFSPPAQMGFQSSVPQRIVGLEGGVTDLSLGSQHLCGVKDGSLLCAWIGYNGRLGNGDDFHYQYPVAVNGMTSGVTKVSAGSATTCAIRNGAAYCWGSGAQGQLGNGTNTSSLEPVLVSGLSSGVTDLSVGDDVVCAVQAGALRCWGRAENGALGNGVTSNTVFNTPQDVTGLGSGVVQVSVGTASRSSCAVASGGVFCWGENFLGELGDGTAVHRSTPVAAGGVTLSTGVSEVRRGWRLTCATQVESVYCWGLGAGVLGDGTMRATPSLVPVAVAQSFPGLARLSLGFNSARICAIGDQVWCWGPDHQDWHTGNTTFFDNPSVPRAVQSSPVVVGGISGVSAIAVPDDDLSVMCLIQNGAVRCRGGFRFILTQGMNGAANGSPFFETMTGMASGYTHLAMGYYALCGISAGSVYCRGAGLYGELGNGSTYVAFPDNPVLATGMTNATALTAGIWTVCAVNSGAAYCWGRNEHGQSGDGTTSGAWTPKMVTGLGSGVTAISTSGEATCAVHDGSAKCWGRNSSGELGDGTTTQRTTPVQVHGLSSGVTAIGVAVGFACAVKDGGVWCWGTNSNGTLGNGTNVSSSTPVAVTGLGSGVVSVHLSAGRACAVTSSGGMKCWGSNPTGQLGDGTTTGRWTPTDVVGLGSGVSAVMQGQQISVPALKGAAVKDGSLYFWGSVSHSRDPGVYSGTLVPVLFRTTQF